MNLQRNMDAIFFATVLTSIAAMSAMAAVPTPVEQAKYVENNIGTIDRPAVVVIHGKRPTIPEKLMYWHNVTMANYGMQTYS